MNQKLLIVDDDPAVLRAVSGLLRDEGYRTELAPDAAAARRALEQPTDPPAMMLLDLRMPNETGLSLLERLPRPLPLPVVVLSGEASAGEAVLALKLGATDFIEKPPTPERLLTAVRNALALRELAEERERLRQELARPSQLLGESAAMGQLRQLIARVGPSDAAILILGETGTGKERVARALHLASGRKGRFVAINCAAIPATLLESELFGHERGAFTGASERRVGRVEQAQGGTLFLDELGDMPMELQAKLLRVLEQKELERLGGGRPIALDVRVLAATHRALEDAVAKGTFRQDLYFRLSVFPLRLPALRERPEDVLPLIRAFAAELAGVNVALEVTAEAEQRLRAYAWPGNVRELRNFIERLCLLRAEGPLRVDKGALSHLGGALKLGAEPLAPAPAGLGERSFRELVEDAERAILRAALDASEGNVAAAARLLKVDRGNLYRRIKALGLPVADA